MSVNIGKKTGRCGTYERAEIHGALYRTENKAVVGVVCLSEYSRQCPTTNIKRLPERRYRMVNCRLCSWSFLSLRNIAVQKVN